MHPPPDDTRVPRSPDSQAEDQRVTVVGVLASIRRDPETDWWEAVVDTTTVLVDPGLISTALRRQGRQVVVTAVPIGADPGVAPVLVALSIDFPGPRSTNAIELAPP